MKIAIHYRKDSFAERWIAYCKESSIEYKIVNVYDSNIIHQLEDCDALMWHHHQSNYKDVLFAKQLLYSLEIAGKRVFPDFNTCWHFDDKVGQKYLLESINAPLVPSYVFYTKKEALEWVDKTVFPKVFKLRGGAGASNVKLVNTKVNAIKLVNKAFSKGFSQYDILEHFKERIRKHKEGKVSFFNVIKGFGRLLIVTEFARMHAPEKGYVYFQDFIPNNKFDIRVVVAGDKAFALKRLVRQNDFRASGGGNTVYKKEEIDERCVKIAFEVNEKIKSQSIAYDFVFDRDNNPLIVEISYGYTTAAYDKCEGYWDRAMNWHQGHNFNFCGWMVEDIIQRKD
jgi:glutathione synthase/RimK-type ligase-like ATP-grasp enzyme